MKALTHITAGRTAIRALIITVVLTAGIVGTSGLAAAEPIDGKGNDVLYESLDGKGNDVLYESLDGKGNDVVTESLGWPGDDTVTAAFPIDNVTVSADYAGGGGGTGKPSF
jgi:hypothetical protein